MVFGNGRSIYNQRVGRISERFRNNIRIVFKVYLCTFCYQRLGERCRGTVIASCRNAILQKIANEGTHSYATSSDKVNSFDIFVFHDG